MEKLEQQIEKKKFGYFKCPFCADISCYTYFDKEMRLSRWLCTACQSFGSMRDLNALVEQNQGGGYPVSENA